MKERIKSVFRKMIKYPVTIWMTLSLIVLSSMLIGFAAYNGTVTVKRVVSTQASSSSAFSSNYMETYSSTNIAIKNLRTTLEGNFYCPVTVCNYDQSDPTTPAKADITYSFTAELVKLNPATNEYVRVTEIQTGENSVVKTFTVQKVMNDNITINTDTPHTLNDIDSNDTENSFSYTYSSETLEGGISQRDTYNLCFDASEVAKDTPELYIRVTAIPTPESSTKNGSGVSNLASVISIAQGRTVETGWHGSLQEASTPATDFDAYNLIIEGSGEGKIDIVWDAAKFTMNPVFVSQYDKITGTRILDDEEIVSGQTKKRTLTVDSATGDNRFVIQFYKAVSGTYTNDEFPSKYIKCENYVPVTDETPTPSPDPGE